LHSPGAIPAFALTKASIAYTTKWRTNDESEINRRLPIGDNGTSVTEYFMADPPFIGMRFNLSTRVYAPEVKLYALRALQTIHGEQLRALSRARALIVPAENVSVILLSLGAVHAGAQVGERRKRRASISAKIVPSPCTRRQKTRRYFRAI